MTAYDRIWKLSWCASALALWPGHAAWAQEAASAPLQAASAPAKAAGASPVALEQVMITAEKRSVDLQKAPLAVSAISGSSLDKSNIVDLAGLNGSVPGLTITKSSGYERMVTIRGVGSETPLNAYTTQPGVALHIDGVYIANSISLDQSLFDLDRIEVLRGPQGTLFGQTSTGGTINLVTKQPMLGEFSGNADVSVGNYRLHRERAEVNVPLAPTWALRASVQDFGHKGFANVTTIPGGYDLDDAKDRGAKLALLWQPDSSFKSTLTGQWYRANQHGAAQKNILDPDPDPRSISQDYPAQFKLDADLYHLNVEWALPWATLKSITAYQSLAHRQQEDNDRLTAAIRAEQGEFFTYDAIAAWNTNLRNFTQEFNLSSKPGGAVDWIVGAFLMKQRSRQYVIEFAGDEASPLLSIPADISSNPPANLEYGEDVEARRTSYAGFFQSTFRANDRLRLTAGARYNHDAYSTLGGAFFGAAFNDGVNPQPLTVRSREYSTHKPTGKLAIDYDLTPSSLVYASITRGYKPGGLNGTGGAVVVPLKFQPETAVSYEVGSKNKLMENTLRLNVAAFYSDYRNMQYLEVDPRPYFYGVSNVPKANIWGAEIEASYLTLGSRLRINGNLTLLNGRFPGDSKTIDAATANQVYATNPSCANGGQYFDSDCWAAVVAASKSLSGSKPPKMPTVQGAVNASYVAPLASGNFTSRIEFVHRGRFNARVFDDAGLDRVPAYSIWNLNFAYDPADSNWAFSVSASNIFNKAGVNSRFTDPYGVNSTSQEFIPPRQVIATVGYTF